MEQQPVPELTGEERQTLLDLARSAVMAAAGHSSPPSVDLSGLSPPLASPAACFVTLTQRGSGELRGCTGVLVARAPLVEEIIRTATQTALHDPRFSPVQPDEVQQLDIEISILTPPRPLEFASPEDIPHLLRPGIDGVTLNKGGRRATFLPQVWQKVADPIEFLNRLCLKMGTSAGAWRDQAISVDIYQVVEFSDHQRRG